MTAETAPGLPAELEAAIDAYAHEIEQTERGSQFSRSYLEQYQARAALVAKLLAWRNEIEEEAYDRALREIQR